MIYHFSDMKKKNDFIEEKLQVLKKDYLKPQMTQDQIEGLRKKMEEANMENKRDYKKKRMIRFIAAAAVFAGAFMILPNTSSSIAYAMGQIPVIGQLVEVVTFRDYEYETDRNIADIKVPEIKTDDTAANRDVQENLKRTTDEINAEIQAITDELIEDFESNLKEDEGYQDVIVDSEILAAASDYFTLKLICYQGAGSGYQWNYYYTIDLNTGERLQLKNIFKSNADYITPISENIKLQMQEQMAANDQVSYWLDDEIDEWNFKAITDETSFYINDKGNVVIGFNEGEVAPMYMGAVEFEIPSEVLQDIRK